MEAGTLAADLFRRYENRTDKNRPYVVALDGLSGAGKTTLVKQLEAELQKKCDVQVIHIDDHIVESSKRYHTGHDEWYEYYSLQWDVDMIKQRLLEAIHRGYSEISLPFYDKSKDSSTLEKIEITRDSIVLIEGIFLLRKEWVHYYDYAFYLDCPREVRYERVLNRDVYIGDSEARLDKYKRRYWPGEEHYLRSESPTKKADLVVYLEQMN
jgi:uridine kinase